MRRRIAVLLSVFLLPCLANAEWIFFAKPKDMIRQRLLTDAFLMQLKDWARCDVMGPGDRPAGCADSETRVMLTYVSFTSKYCVVDPAILSDNSVRGNRLTKDNVVCIANVKDVVDEAKAEIRACLDLEETSEVRSCMKSQSK